MKTRRYTFDGNNGITAVSFVDDGTFTDQVLARDSIEVGKVDGSATTPYIDFHSGATVVDYDTRILSDLPTGVTGGGRMNYTASGGHVFYGDATSPAKAAFSIVPQDAQPTGANSVGDIYVTTAGVLKICTVAGTPGTWVSVGSQV